MSLRIFHTVNSGLLLFRGECGLAVDAIHGAHKGFSAMPEAAKQDMLHCAGVFSGIRGALFTHAHSDHYDRSLFDAFLERNGPMPFYGPGISDSSVQSSGMDGGLQRIDMQGITIFAKDTPHDGRGFEQIPHQSYWVSIGEEGEWIFIAGDGQLCGEDADGFCRMTDGTVSAAFCNPFQILSSDGQQFLRRMAPQQIYLYHIPLEEDDCYCCHNLAAQILRKPPRGLPEIKPLAPMQWIGTDREDAAGRTRKLETHR